ncbi:hypothetical protein NMG60_11027168 [Bertholletia excelsa]
MAMLDSYVSKLKAPLQKSPLLKDFLLDDMSSCSSNGFRSYQRRQCCATVRFDLKTRDSNRKEKSLKSRRKSASTTRSAFQRASEVVISVVKLLPFAASAKSPSSAKHTKTKSSIQLSSLSRKLLKRSFWKQSTEKKIERWKSFKSSLERKEQPPAFSPVTTTSTTIITATDSNSSTSESNSNSNSWTDSDFTSDYFQSSSGNSDSPCANDVVEGAKRLPESALSNKAGATAGDDSTAAAAAKNVGPGGKEKEHFSPVSVLDLPFDDVEEEVSSPFQCKPAGGRKQKPAQVKIRRSLIFTNLKPVDLEEHFSLSVSTDESTKSPSQTFSVSTKDNFHPEGEEEKGEHKAEDLLEQIKSTVPWNSLNFDPEILLLDFFKERFTEPRSSTGLEKLGFRLIIVAKEWLAGHPREKYLEWKEQKNREAYVRDLERGGKWCDLEGHKEEVAMEVEVEVFDSLVNELLLDFFFLHKTEWRVFTNPTFL